MIDRKALLTDLQKLLPKIEADLLERTESAEVPDVGQKLREEYASAQAAERTAQSFTEWRSDAITQAAAAWVLSCVFVRFLEDNQLVPTPKIAGPNEGLKRARDEHELYFRTHPTFTDRDYLLAVFDGLTKNAATKDVFGEHNPIRDLPNWLSGDAAGALIAFFQRVDSSTGVLVHDFTDPTWDTRFLGDLYQDVSEAARKKYALLQTPVFVEEFILDRTLDPAIEEFGLAKMGYETRLEPTGRLHPDDRFKMIDPACGSGHFLLGSFSRLVDRWRRREPGTNERLLVQRALDSVHGVDVNPYAIAIARFRMLLAALKECGITRLSDAPGFAIHMACGDSLLHGSPGGDQATMGWAPTDHVYQPEDRDALERLLQPKTYHTVVANPPYITPKDRALNQAYRDRYTTCYMKYSLAVPFLERIVSLAIHDGFTGQITANSFMKREFGKKLIEEFFPRIDLTHVIDTSGLSFGSEGFGGVPTVILCVRNRSPVARTIRTIMGIRGEPRTPDDPARGLVWSAIVRQVDAHGSKSEYVEVADFPRQTFQKHPWSIGGRGAAELKIQLDENASCRLDDLISSAGFMAITGEDEIFVAPGRFWDRRIVSHRAFGAGDSIRDWRIQTNDDAAFMYRVGDNQVALQPLDSCQNLFLLFWSYRTNLRNRLMFGKLPEQSGLTWYEYRFKSDDRLRSRFLIVFAELSTHNRFVLDRGGKVYKQTAPVIKLPPDASEDEHLAILGVLNSSTACFWTKQVFQNKGSSVDQHGTRRTSVAFENFWQLDSTKMRQFPIPPDRPLRLARSLDQLAALRAAFRPSNVVKLGPVTRLALQIAHTGEATTRSQMISLQEELDWQCYRHYGLLEEDLCYKGLAPGLQLGQRAFEILMARKLAAGELATSWFERHGSAPITEIPAGWPDDYRQLVERRIALIESDPNIRLIEQPEYKRRWNTEPWESQLERALRDWLLDHLESYCDFDGRMNEDSRPTAKLPIALVSIGKLADVARNDADFLQVGEIYRNDPAFDVSRLVTELVEAESVPLLSILRYKATGLRKRAEWETTWDLQRQEDSIDARAKLPNEHRDHLTEPAADALKKKQVGTIPVPPKYTSTDFLKSDYWRLRGKLDVPKERWASFPHCQAEDGTPMVAWAGYDHLQLAKAISAFYVDVQERLGGRDDRRLVPLLACLIELLPWLKQWHNEVDPEFRLPMGDYFEGFLQEESRNLGLSLDEIRAWQPPQRGSGRGRRRANG